MEKILVIGSSNVDLVGVGKEKTVLSDSNIGQVDLMVGGVGKNIAENLKLLRTDVSFLTFIGNDFFAKVVTDHLDRLALDYHKSIWTSRSTGKYLAVHDPSGALVVGVNDMGLVEQIEISDLEERKNYIDLFDTLILETNIPESILSWILETFSDKTIIVDGVSTLKVGRIKKHLANIDLLKVNHAELKALMDSEELEIIPLVKKVLKTGLKQIIVTNGANPVTYNTGTKILQSPILPAKIIKSSVGCGDAFLSGTVYGLVHNLSMDDAIERGKKAAALTMEVYSACNPELTPEMLEE